MKTGTAAVEVNGVGFFAAYCIGENLLQIGTVKRQVGVTITLD